MASAATAAAFFATRAASAASAAAAMISAGLVVVDRESDMGSAFRVADGLIRAGTYRPTIGACLTTWPLGFVLGVGGHQQGPHQDLGGRALASGRFLAQRGGDRRCRVDQSVGAVDGAALQQQQHGRQAVLPSGQDMTAEADRIAVAMRGSGADGAAARAGREAVGAAGGVGRGRGHRLSFRVGWDDTLTIHRRKGRQ